MGSWDPASARARARARIEPEPGLLPAELAGVLVVLTQHRNSLNTGGTHEIHCSHQWNEFYDRNRNKNRNRNKTRNSFTRLIPSLQDISKISGADAALARKLIPSLWDISKTSGADAALARNCVGTIRRMSREDGRRLLQRMPGSRHHSEQSHLHCTITTH